MEDTVTTTTNPSPADFEQPRDVAIEAVYDHLTSQAGESQSDHTRSLAKIAVDRLVMDGFLRFERAVERDYATPYHGPALTQQESDALEAQARAAYEDAVRLDAFGPEEARQAFLEGYVRGATA